MGVANRFTGVNVHVNAGALVYAGVNKCAWPTTEVSLHSVEPTTVEPLNNGHIGGQRFCPL